MLGLACIVLAGDVLWKAIGNGYMLVLTMSAMLLVLGLHGLHANRARPGMRGLGWLRSFGRLSHGIYLTHMFVVFAIVGLFRASGGDLRSGFGWDLPTVAACWLLGAIVARGFSDPCDRALRRRLLGGAPATPRTPDLQAS